MSKKKIFKAILLALTVLLTAAQNADGKEEPAKFSDDPDTYWNRGLPVWEALYFYAQINEIKFRR